MRKASDLRHMDENSASNIMTLVKYLEKLKFLAWA